MLRPYNEEELVDVLRKAGLEAQNLHKLQANKPHKTIQCPVFMPKTCQNTGANTPCTAPAYLLDGTE
jgi:hypothetical protein